MLLFIFLYRNFILPIHVENKGNYDFSLSLFSFLLSYFVNLKLYQFIFQYS